ncbi:DUF1178 family protein [Acetobacteraceae bacterium H6797]|nr:DUF1178 family protein [Acetobacteraceae bacterium H6797]
MIHYQLRCEAGHEFDGWFKDSAGFEKQAAAGLVECPVCGVTKVTRALMAPNIAKTREALPASQATPPAAGEGQMAAAGPMPAQMLALLQRLRAEVEKNCDYVGANFAEEARRIHREAEEGTPPQRGIYGEASEAETEALRDEGIEVGRLPWVPRSDG